MPSCSLPRSTLVLLPILAGLSTSAAAQRYWSNDIGRGGVGVETLKPLFKGVDESLLNGAAFVNATIRVKPNWYVEAEVPLARSTLGIGGSSSLVGDPYIGVRYRSPSRGVAARFGARVPTSFGDESRVNAAEASGLSADYDRWEAFPQKLFSARGAVEVTKRDAAGLLAAFSVGSTFMVSTEGGDPEAFLDYGGRVGFDGSKALVAAEFTGRAILTEDLSYGDRSIHQIAGVVELRAGRIRPHARVRVPLDRDFRAAVGAIVGVGVSVLF